MDKQENSETIQNTENTDTEIDEQELIDMECPTDSEEPLEVAMEYELKI